MKKANDNNSQEQWALIREGKYKQYYVSTLGRCKIVTKRNGESQLCPLRENKAIGYVQFAGDYVHRHVAKAFIPNPDGLEQVDHINSDRLDNRVENLRWMTREENNRREHAQKLKSQNSTQTNHSEQVLKATRGSVTKFFLSGRDCAKALGCTSVLVYKAACQSGSARRAKGWTLEWISREEPIAAEAVEKLLGKREIKRQRKEEMRQKKMKEKKLKRLKERAKKSITKIDTKIEKWQQHIEDCKVECQSKIQHLEAKLSGLVAERERLEQSLKKMASREGID